MKRELKKEIVNYLKNIQNFTLQHNPRKMLSEMAKNINPKFNSKYSKYFATKADINPHKIVPEIEFIENNNKLSEIFKSCLSFWSTPVSSGYGRRIRIIIWDKNNYKVIGIVGLCDPVIGMSVRDNYISWNKEQRKERLYNCMTAYVLGAVPPYNELLCGKLVALLTISSEVVNYFKNKYQGNKTIIAGKQKPAELVTIDTMGAFGKSAIYNRLRGWNFVGYSKGYTHYHLTSNGFFEKISDFLIQNGEIDVFKKNCYGHGPNWKFRVIKKGLSLLGIKTDALLLGIKRGYYIAPLAANWKEFLRMETNKVEYNVFTKEEQIEYWKQRWLSKKIKE